MMEYHGYTARVEFDPDADLFHGHVLGLRDAVTFQGRSVAELRREFRHSVDDYLEFCASRGEEPERPFSGRVLLRMTPELHRAIALAAERAGVSLNAWIVGELERGTSEIAGRSMGVRGARAGGRARERRVGRSAPSR
jgi:predicted HicB family RNase H-like nuclease